jgi:hypothetical protein
MLYNPAGYIQSVFSEITVDTSTTGDTNWHDLLTATIITSDTYVNIWAVASAEDSEYNSCKYQITVDTVAKRGWAIDYETIVYACGGVFYKMAVAAGTHTIKLQYGVTNSSDNNSILVVTHPTYESATLLVVETSF